jgi:hypothetical protein
MPSRFWIHWKKISALKGKMENTARAPKKESVKLRYAKAVFQVCFKFERKLGNLGSEISAKK